MNQFTVIEGQNNRRPDIVVFVNGLPLGIIELKIPEDTDKWFAAAYNQIQTYKQEIPSLMHYNELTVISDGLEARIGSLTANRKGTPRERIAGTGSRPTKAKAADIGTVRLILEPASSFMSRSQRPPQRVSG